MADALEKIQSIFQESKSFALFSKDDCEEHKLLAKETLKHALSQKGIATIALPDHLEFKKKWKNIIPENKNSILPQQTSIRIPKNQYKVKELSYEENDGFLSLVVTSESGELNKDSVIFEPILPKVDAAFCFFEPTEINLLSEFENRLILPTKEKIIFLTSGEKTFAEKISQIINLVAAETFSLPTTATLLFAGLITETSNFTRPINQEVLRFGSELLSLGANKEAIKAIIDEGKNISFMRLLGRALARTHIEESPSASWTFLSRNDLEKTGHSQAPPLFFHNIAKNLRELIPFRAVSLLFWQNKQVFVLAAADEEKEIALLSRHLGAELQSNFFVAGPFENFSEAEMQLKKAFEETVSLKI